MNFKEAMDNKKLVLGVIHIIKEYCPNNDEGYLCKNYKNCLECWEQMLQLYTNRGKRAQMNVYDDVSGIKNL